MSRRSVILLFCCCLATPCDRSDAAPPDEMKVIKAAELARFELYNLKTDVAEEHDVRDAHRYPHYSVNLSADDGLNWDEGTVIDYTFWGMGCLIEVEPDVVLCTYMNWDRSQPLLAQLIKVTPKGVKPF